MSYKDVAMITRLRIEMPQMTKKDQKATDDAESANAAHGAGQYRKQLYPKHLIDPISQVGSSARAYMYSQTRQVGNSGQFYLSNRRIVGYLDQMGKFELAFWQSVTAFLNNWSNVMLEAQQQQGMLFDPTLYPDLSTLKGQFVFEYPLVSVSNANDLVLNELTDDMANVIKAKALKDEADAHASLVKSAFIDLREQVLRIIKQTTLASVMNKNGEVVEKSGKLYETLTQDIADLTDVLRDLDFGGNKNLASIADEIDMHLTLPVQALKNDTEVIRLTNQKAKDILSQMEAFL